jgi:hypothetical protein
MISFVRDGGIPIYGDVVIGLFGMIAGDWPAPSGGAALNIQPMREYIK